MSENPELDQALVSLRESPHWPVLVSAFRARREKWIKDMDVPLVYCNHPELAHTAARLAENDYWIEQLLGDEG